MNGLGENHSRWQVVLAGTEVLVNPDHGVEGVAAGMRHRRDVERVRYQPPRPAAMRQSQLTPVSS